MSPQRPSIAACHLRVPRPPSAPCLMHPIQSPHVALAISQYLLQMTHSVSHNQSTSEGRQPNRIPFRSLYILNTVQCSQEPPGRMHWAYPSPTNNDNPYLATMSRVYVSIQRWTRRLHLLLLLLRGRIDVDYIWRRTQTAFVTKCNETDLILQTGDLETRSFDQGWMEERIRSALFIWKYTFGYFSRNTVTKYMVMRCMLAPGTRHHLLDSRVDLFCGNLRVCRIAGRKIPGKCTLIQREDIIGLQSEKPVAACMASETKNWSYTGKQYGTDQNRYEIVIFLVSMVLVSRIK